MQPKSLYANYYYYMFKAKMVKLRKKNLTRRLHHNFMEAFTMVQ
jgi:hypothetical protein